MRLTPVGLLAALVLAAPAAAAPTPTPYEGTAQGRFFHIIPPGEAGNANSFQATQFLAGGGAPEHFSDQRDAYTNLIYATPGLQDADIGKYFPDASFGVRPEDIARTYSPRDDVTIVRDKSFGIPHVYGATRAGTAFGIGYAIAEDRLFFMDVLRHYGNANLASFAGGANVETDREQWESAPYTEADLAKQIELLPQRYGQAGQNLVEDAKAWCDGVNAFIAEAKLDPSKLPVEYPAVNLPQGPDPWTPTNVLNVASLIGAQLGNGGGDEMEQIQQLMADIERFGPKRGLEVWRDFRSVDDPESPVTASRKQGFPYGMVPKRNPLRYAAIPDRGSLKFVSTIKGEADKPAEERQAFGPIKGLLEFPHSDSNALLVSASRSSTGHPLSAFGSQAGYFEPESWWHVEAHGPGFDVRGANIPGTGPYVEIGRGRDYAWSATSASQDITDVYALETCQDDMHYRYRGECLAMEPVERTESWSPSAADQTPAGSVTFRVLRTKLGLVVARATIKGKPVVYTKLRATYLHELDSAPGFQEWNDPEKMVDAQAFQRAAMKVGYTFNWLYADDRDIAYINTGSNPIRPTGVNGLLPIKWSARTEWKGYDPAINVSTYQPMAQRPQAINQPYLVSWNNKQARHCCGGLEYTPVWRSTLIADEIDARLRGGRKVSLGQVVDAVEEAATKDLRGTAMVAPALKILGDPKDPALAEAATKLRAWIASGSHRRDKDRDGHYDDTDAVRIVDAWYATLPKAVFGPRMGDAVFKRYDEALSPDLPNSYHHQAHAHLGSAWEDGWFGPLNKDLRTILNPRKVKGKWSVRYCGKGKLKACRAAVTASLAEALKLDAAKLYADPTLASEDCGNMDQQACYDALRYRPLGLVTQPMQPWQNRPTQQQVVEVTSHRPR